MELPFTVMEIVSTCIRSIVKHLTLFTFQMRTCARRSLHCSVDSSLLLAAISLPGTRERQAVRVCVWLASPATLNLTQDQRQVVEHQGRLLFCEQYHLCSVLVSMHPASQNTQQCNKSPLSPVAWVVRG